MPQFRAIPVAACLLALSQLPAAAAGPSGSTNRACLPAALKNVLAEIESRYGAVRVISTHRPGARIAGSQYASLHASCRAVDFHPAVGTYDQVLAHVCANWKGGIGTYSGQLHHLHLDVGYAQQFHTHVPAGTLVARRQPRTRAAAVWGDFGSMVH
jgi:hypothetical protein